MKKNLILIAASLIVSSAFADDIKTTVESTVSNVVNSTNSIVKTDASITTDDSGPSFSLIPSYVSSYLWRGQQLEGASFQNDITMEYGNLELGFWGNLPVAHHDNNDFNPEMEPYGSYSFDIIKDKLSLAPGFTLYTYINAPANKITFEPNLKLTYTIIKNLTVAPELYYDIILRATTAELTVNYTIPVKLSIIDEIDITAQGGNYVVNNDVGDSHYSGNYWLAGVLLPYSVTKNSKLSLGYSYTKGHSAQIETASKGFVTVSYEFDF